MDSGESWGGGEEWPGAVEAEVSSTSPKVPTGPPQELLFWALSGDIKG